MVARLCKMRRRAVGLRRSAHSGSACEEHHQGAPHQSISFMNLLTRHMIVLWCGGGTSSNTGPQRKLACTPSGGATRERLMHRMYSLWLDRRPEDGTRVARDRGERTSNRPMRQCVSEYDLAPHEPPTRIFVVRGAIAFVLRPRRAPRQPPSRIGSRSAGAGARARRAGAGPAAIRSVKSVLSPRFEEWTKTWWNSHRRGAGFRSVVTVCSDSVQENIS